jgi:Zn-finger protein
MLFVGKLPAIELHAAVHVFKCSTCLIIHAQEAIKTTGAKEAVAI